jgi:diguanylate cyclase (GGDEF)-like protein/PAS domain S-box-containing protein
VAAQVAGSVGSLLGARVARSFPQLRRAAAGGTERRGLLQGLRTLALYFSLANLAVALPFATMYAPGTATVALAWLAVAVLALWLVAGSARRHFSWTLDTAGLAGVVTIATMLGPSAIGVAIACVWVRALHGARHRAVTMGVLLAAAYSAPLLLGAPTRLALAPSPGAADTATTLLSTGLLLMVAPVLNEVSRTLQAHQQSAARGRVLHEAGTALHAADDPQAIGVVTAEAAHELLAQHPGRTVSISVVDGDDLVGVGQGARPFGAFAPLAALSAEERATLAEGGLVTTRALETRVDGIVESSQGAPDPVLLVPMSARHTLRGLIAVGPSPPHGAGGACDCIRLLQTLGGQAAMALESTALTDDLVRSETRFRSLVQHSSDVIVLLDWNGSVRYVSPAVARVLGYAPAALTGQPFEHIVHPDDAPGWREALRRVVAERVQTPLDCRLQHRHRSWRHAEILATNLLGEPSVGGVVLNVRDVSERRVLEDELLHRAYHDPLTGVPNRSRFLERIATTLADEGARGRVAVLFIDLDGFKLVNDSFGHATGDRVLLSVAKRLEALAPGPDDLARLSGDEFAVLLHDVAGEAEASAFAKRVHEKLSEPHSVHNQVMRVTASVGVAMGGSSVEDAEDLLHRADLAMYTVKAGSKNGVRVLAAGTDSPEGSRQLQADLQWAVLRGEFEVRYQPILRVSDGHVTGAEALARWRHPVKGLLGPDTFIPMAEASDLISDVFEYVLQRACESATAWQDLRPADQPMGVSVNLSAVQLQQTHLLDQVQRALRGTGLPPSLLTLEITESILVEDPRHAIEMLATLKQLGVRIAVDDFGTGYSSLAYLRRLPIDILKIDRVFLTGIDSRDDAPLAPMIIDLGKRLAMPTIAEGVERRGQLDALRALGCDYAQGHLFSRPVAAERIAELLADRRLLAI